MSVPGSNVSETNFVGARRPESADHRLVEALRRSFFLGLAVLATAFVLIGFGYSTFLPLMHGDVSPHAWYVYVHGVSLFGWTGLLLFQTTMVARGRIGVHRTAGRAALILVPTVVLSSLMVVVESTRSDYASDPSGAAARLFGQMASFGGFALLTLMALTLVGLKDWHKRLMAFSMLLVLDAAVARIPFLGSHAEYVTVTLGVAVAVYDVVDRRRLHPATVIGLALLLGIEFGADLIGMSTAWRGFARKLLSQTG